MEVIKWKIKNKRQNIRKKCVLAVQEIKNPNAVVWDAVAPINFFYKNGGVKFKRITG